MKALLRLFFKLLYHQFAFAYDLVAATVSFNRWKNWIESVIPFIRGTRLLELGHGPGHLQRLLLTRGWTAIALDESSQMGRLAQRTTEGKARLARGLAQQIPFPNETFDTVISTFPSEYIFDPRTLAEVRRCLSDGGRFIVLPVAMPKRRLLQWLYRVTGETPANALEFIRERMEKPFAEAGFDVDTKWIERESGTLVILIAENAKNNR